MSETHPSNNVDTNDLIVRHLDGRLDAEGQQQLARLLEGSPAARERLASYLRMEAATFRLAAVGGLMPDRAVGDAAQQDTRVGVFVTGPRRAGTRKAAGIAAIAAGILICVGLWAWRNTAVVDGPREVANKVHKQDDLLALALAWSQIREADFPDEAPGSGVDAGAFSADPPVEPAEFAEAPNEATELSPTAAIATESAAVPPEWMLEAIRGLRGTEKAVRSEEG